VTGGRKPDQPAEKLAIHRTLVNRILARAIAKGAPLTSLQIQQFDSDVMSKGEYKTFRREFERENDWIEFQNRVSGLLRDAIAEDAANDSGAPARYDDMVHKLEDRPESFTLWACCVPAISGYKSIDHRSAVTTQAVVLALVLAVIAYIILHALKVL
jgi:hypothetical protein